jgi:protein-arginine kinase activator protein McsA
LCHSAARPKVKKIHDKEAEVYHCYLCEKEFKRNDNLTRHKKIVHNTVYAEVDLFEQMKNEEDVYECKVCKMTFSDPEGDKNLVSHLVKRCKPYERFYCDTCGKDFSIKFNMEQHRKKYLL